LGVANWIKSQNDKNLGNLVPTEEEIEIDRQREIDGKASKLGMSMAIVGTLIWAYGDLIGDLLC
jgi:hypothetical protein